MKYCTFKYRIEYEDGEVCKGWCPFRGKEISDPVLIKFVNEHFRVARPARRITIQDVFKINNVVLWLAHVQHTVEYKYLIASKVFVKENNDGELFGR